ncbi:Putative secreted protein [Alloactinosynnema sp. L-07]|uniref:hypothetical protein n=1 Tax=Alloactinosynnema sp. L-07 TaxID=1653480 RepID=UPI00065EF847|nr:hypothetical protein [Alloactinosynnema sp. L-07]CRK55135.1 Putative secreted protein [Alloactinosynnema sp. L-07]
MNTAAKLTAYGAALALAAGGAWAIGTAVGPLSADSAARADGHGGAHGGTVAESTPNDLPKGLASSRGGFTFTPTHATLPSGSAQQFSFRITKPGGDALTAFDIAHDKPLHLIVVRRDTSGFQHVHPTMAADGTWSVPLNLRQAGSYRAFADFAPTGAEPLTLGVDFAVPGDSVPVEHPESRVATVDGYEVRLTGDLVSGSSSKVVLSVTRDSKPVGDLQPYLGAYGHLVALRGGDLAYLHVHPEGVPGDGKTRPGPNVVFFAEVPSPAVYRLFLDFQHDGVVRTAEFTVSTNETTPSTMSTPSTSASAGHGGHN